MVEFIRISAAKFETLRGIQSTRVTAIYRYFAHTTCQTESSNASGGRVPAICSPNWPGATSDSKLILGYPTGPRRVAGVVYQVQGQTGLLAGLAARLSFTGVGAAFAIDDA